MLTVRNMTFSYAEPVLEEACFVFKPGKLYFLLARNGAGKSTLFKLLAGELQASSGEIHMTENLIFHRQQPVYFEDMTVRENIECFLQLLKTKARYEELRDEYHLESIESKIARKLSGGEKQRLYLALTGMSDAGIQLYDEADAALDAGARQQYYQEVLQRNASEGRIVIAISHHISESLKYADRICVLTERKLYEVDPAELPQELADLNEDKIMEYIERVCMQP